jgi:hypothetical protein
MRTIPGKTDNPSRLSVFFVCGQAPNKKPPPLELQSIGDRGRSGKVLGDPAQTVNVVPMVEAA